MVIIFICTKWLLIILSLIFHSHIHHITFTVTAAAHSTVSYYCIFCAPFYNTLLFTTMFFKFFYCLQIHPPFILNVYYLHQFTASCPPRLIPQSLELGDIAKVSTPNETFAAMISSTRKKETCNHFLFYKIILLTMCCKSEYFAHANSVSLPHLNSMLGLCLSVCYEMKLNHSHIIEFGSKL